MMPNGKREIHKYNFVGCISQDPIRKTQTTPDALSTENSIQIIGNTGDYWFFFFPERPKRGLRDA